MNKSCVHHDIPQDLTLAAEESSHPPLPHLVVSTIKVWRTRTPFLVRHLWILDWLKSRRSVIGSDTIEGPIRRPDRAGRVNGSR
jgi:hypothetical protein